MTNRRSFITLLSGAAAWPLAVNAQQRAMPLVAFINSGSAGGFQHLVLAFRQGLKEAG
jgi:putative ABC transport system substrate-binding protein